MSSAKKVTIVNYGVGNLFSLVRAFERLGAEVIVTSDKDELRKAEHLVLPGVGAFETAIKFLKERELTGIITDLIKAEVPTIGICLGMQLLAEESTEGGRFEGLGVLKGSVEHLRTVDDSNRIPNINWQEIQQSEGKQQETLFKDIPKDSQMYFLHSYCLQKADEANVVAWTNFGEGKYPAAVRKNSVVGCQFHPEKSGEAGQKFLENFLNCKGKRG